VEHSPWLHPELAAKRRSMSLASAADSKCASGNTCSQAPTTKWTVQAQSHLPGKPLMKLSYIALLLLIVSAVAAVRAEPLDSPSAELPDTRETHVGPWNLADLRNTIPAVNWIRQDQPVHSLTYAGEAFQGRPTEVFAFYASPLT